MAEAQHETIRRREFLKGAGASVGGALLGQLNGKPTLSEPRGHSTVPQQTNDGRYGPPSYVVRSALAPCPISDVDPGSSVPADWALLRGGERRIPTDPG